MRMCKGFLNRVMLTAQSPQRPLDLRYIRHSDGYHVEDLPKFVLESLRKDGDGHLP